MATLRNILVKTPPAWQVGMPDETEGMYLKGGTFSSPDTVVPLSKNQPVVCAALGAGQFVGFGNGGAFAVGG